MRNAYKAYRKAAVKTADPREIVIMLYDGFLRHTMRAKSCLERGDKPETSQSVGKALAITQELMHSLEHKHNPEIAGNLEALYVYIGERLLKVSMRQDADALNEVITLMTELREGWAGALDQVRSVEGGRMAAMP